jgi:hypothetical protein
MKQFFFIVLLVLTLASCGDSPAELRSKCIGILNDPDMKEYYQADMKEYYQAEYVTRWREEVKGCGNDPECLQICYDMLVGKLASAQEGLPGVHSGIK